MRVCLMSDLHLEFDMNFKMQAEGDVLVLAGDIGVFARPNYLDKILEWKNNFSNIIYVPGNHEYYHGDIAKVDTELQHWANINGIIFLQDEYVVIDQTLFVGATLWTDFFIKNSEQYANTALNDFRLVTDSNRPFLGANSVLKHERSLELIKSCLKNIEVANKKVVITHHAPTFQSCHPRFAGSILNSAFASNLENFILRYQPDYWFHGHVHDPVNLIIGKTNVVCNPKGYPGEYTTNFNHNLILEI